VGGKASKTKKSHTASYYLRPHNTIHDFRRKSKMKTITLLNEKVSKRVQHQFLTIMASKLNLYIEMLEDCDDENDWDGMVESYEMINAFCAEINNVSRQIKDYARPELPKSDEVKF